MPFTSTSSPGVRLLLARRPGARRPGRARGPRRRRLRRLPTSPSLLAVRRFWLFWFWPVAVALVLAAAGGAGPGRSGVAGVDAVGELGRLDEDCRPGVAWPALLGGGCGGRGGRPPPAAAAVVGAAASAAVGTRFRRGRRPVSAASPSRPWSGSGGTAWPRSPRPLRSRCRRSAVPEVTPVASRIWSMMSAFFVRLVVLSDMAWAMALSSSRSLPSRTERSSCCSAVIGLLFREGRRLPGRGSARGERNFREEKGFACECPPPDHRCLPGSPETACTRGERFEAQWG